MFGIYTIYWVLGIVMLPGLALGIWAQTKVYTTFNQYNSVQTQHGLTASGVARYMLDGAGYPDVKIAHIRGELTDNFNPQTNTISLSDAVYNQSTISAVGVTAHEIGHVVQHKTGYGLIKLRNILVPIINFLGYFVWPFIFIGLILEIMYASTAANWLIYIGLALYSFNILFCLITLPIELNASKRAYKMLLATGEMDMEEANQAKQVLNAAAWTYVAALVTSVLSLVRLLLMIFMVRGGGRRD